MQAERRTVTSTDAGGRDSWVDAETDPKLIRSYDHPTDGRYLLGADVVAWIRDLSVTASDSPEMGALYAPLLKRMAETVEGWLTDG